MSSFKILVNDILLEEAEIGLISVGAVCLLLIVVAVVLTNKSMKKGAEDVKHTSLDNGKMPDSDSVD